MKLSIRICIVIVSVFLSGCLGIRHLKDGETLLHKQDICGTGSLNKEELYSLYQQTPNHRFPIPIFVWLYHNGNAAYDTSKVNAKIKKIEAKYEKKITENLDNPRKFSNLSAKKAAKIEKQEQVLNEGNMLMRWGEKLAIYDSTKTEDTRERINRYVHSKGYFHADTRYTIQKKGRKIKVIYNINLGKPFTLETVSYQTADTGISSIIKKNYKESFLVSGENYDQSKFSRERDRLDILLKNSGYFDFNKQYVRFEVDSTIGSNGVYVNTIITNPQGRDNHKVFVLDSVNFRTDANIVASGNNRITQEYNSIIYEYYRKRFSKKVLDSRLFIYPNQVYSRLNTFNTQRQLANLDMFRFVNINYDTVGGKMVANIYASPLKKFQTSNELGIGVNVTAGFPGPFYNVSFKNRNLFGGLEILEFNGRLGIEGLPVNQDQREIYSSQEITGNFSLTFPQFIVPFSNKIRSSLGTLNPKTRITIGDSYINRPDYKRNNLNGSIAYNWFKNNKQFIFTLDEVGIINSQISDEFEEQLESRRRQGSNLFRSFDSSFVSSMSLITSINFNSYGFSDKKSSLLKVFFESGGTTLNFFSDDQLRKIFNNFEVYKYLKLNLDFRRNLPLSSENTIAYRINLGMAKPYSSNNVLPYEKYFFAGGSNGIRAWRPRRLGPGSYTPLDSESGRYDDRFEQFGEIILEMSLEVRRNLFGFVDGAIFVDAGNIWTFNEEDDRVGGQFKFNRFYKEIAVGSGFGLRLDFSFLVLRFDGAFKIYDPSRAEGSRFFLSKGYDNPIYDSQKQFLINIGIGYPF